MASARARFRRSTGREDGHISRALRDDLRSGVRGIDCLCDRHILVNGRPISDLKSAASAGLGFLFTALATVTGMLFARTQWGTAWNWDPRETSILMLLLVYAAYFALRGALPSSAVRARISSVYNILASLVMVFLVFVVPRTGQSLHPSNTLVERGGLSPEYRIVMGAAMLGFVLVYVWILRIRIRISEIEADRARRPRRGR